MTQTRGDIAARGVDVAAQALRAAASLHHPVAYLPRVYPGAISLAARDSALYRVGAMALAPGGLCCAPSPAAALLSRRYDLENVSLLPKSINACGLSHVAGTGVVISFR
jgi:hypothetical protein